MLGYVRRGWRNVRAAGVRRLVFTGAALIAALLVARLSWEIGFIREAERAFYDFRVLYDSSQAPADQAQRILLVVYDDDTLIETRKRSPLDRGLLARALTQMDKMGAKAIGIDILIDQPQDEDEELLAALKAMKTPTYLAFASEETNRADINYNQQQFLEHFLAELKGTNVHAASVRMTTDTDGVRRAWDVPPPGLPPPLAISMARAGGEDVSAFEHYDGGVRFRVPADPDRGVFQKLKIDLYANPDIAPALSPQVAGRYVLVGGDIYAIDQISTPLTRFQRATIPGLAMHAHMLAQMLDHKLPRQWSSGALWAMAVLVVVSAALTGMTETHWLRILPFIALQFLLFVGLPVIAQLMGQDTVGMPAVGWAVGWVIAFSSAGSTARAVGTEQRRFAQSALGKYLPRDIAQQIIVKPELLALHGEKREIYALFSDLEGFTKLSHAIAPEMVATLLNRYLDMLSAVVLDHGGVIDKFVGDAVVAFWGAPIARPDDADNAARAAYAMWQAGESFRRNVPEGVPPIGKTRVGLHFGEAIVGNFGGEGRIQYTALGDSMNTAARLESANKSLGSSVLASREAVERTSLDWWRPMGRVVLRGRSTPIEIFEPAPDFPAGERDRLGALLALPRQCDRLAGLEALAHAHPRDEALAYLLVRETNCRNGEAYELG